jgi:hypothetical protein
MCIIKLENMLPLSKSNSTMKKEMKKIIKKIREKEIMKGMKIKIKEVKREEETNILKKR